MILYFGSLSVPVWLAILAAVSFNISGVLSIMAFYKPTNKMLWFMCMVSNSVSGFWTLFTFIVSCGIMRIIVISFSGPCSYLLISYHILLISLIMIADIVLVNFIIFR